MLSAAGAVIPSTSSSSPRRAYLFSLLGINGAGKSTFLKILSGELTVKNDKKEDVLVTYDVALDVDKDGEITADDLLNILAYINGAKDYADVTKA